MRRVGRVYYNENDELAAAWLSELIARGHLPAGDVDVRSVRDVAPDDLTAYTQCHFFAGIGGWAYALQLADWPQDEPIWTGSCPCQSFSMAGNRAGFDDERHLWPVWFRLIAACRPPVVTGEQVESAIGHGWLTLVRTDLEREGYEVGRAVLPAACVGAPHARHRLYWVADTDGRESRHRGLQRGGRHVQLAQDEAARGMALDCGERREGERLHLQPREPRQPRVEVDGRGTARDMAHPGREHAGRRLPRPGEGPDAGADGSPNQLERSSLVGEPDASGRTAGAVPVFHQTDEGWPRRATPRSGDARELGHSSGARLQERLGVGGVPADPVGAPARQAPERTGDWDRAEWLYCRDGKWRPVEPGTFPLAHGLPARVGRLRGYGNAIVPQVAQVFIESYREARIALDSVRVTT